MASFLGIYYTIIIVRGPQNPILIIKALILGLGVGLGSRGLGLSVSGFFFVGFGLFLRLLGLRLFGLRDEVNEGLYG